MAIITLKELCYGERYGVISEVFKTIVNKTQSSIPENFDTFRDLEYVRQTLIAVKKMQENGDYISEYELEHAPVVLSVDDQRFYREQIAMLYPDVEEKYLKRAFDKWKGLSSANDDKDYSQFAKILVAEIVSESLKKGLIEG